MKVVVLGGGVIGVTTAWALARQGAEVTVVERQSDAVMETSFANAGQVSPGYSTPWAAPGIPIKALGWLFQSHAPLAIRPDGSLFQWRWMAAMLANCSVRRYAVNKERMMRLSEYSRDCLRAWRTETGIAYDERSGGTLQLFRSQAQLDAAARDVAVLQDCGVPFELLDTAAVVRVEPALARASAPIAGGLRLPNDETGDCHLFTRQLAERARALGVLLRTGCRVQALMHDGRRINGVQLTDADGLVQTVQADRYVLAPQSTVLDETYKIALTRLGDRIRVGGMAELMGFDLRLNPRRRATREKVTRELFPGGDLEGALFWTGLRPMTPVGTPLVGATPLENLYLNTGHGTLGWTMTCGSAQLLADLISGRQPAIRTEGLDMGRYGQRGGHKPPKRAGSCLRPLASGGATLQPVLAHGFVAGGHLQQGHVALRLADQLDAHGPGLLRVKTRGQADGGKPGQRGVDGAFHPAVVGVHGALADLLWPALRQGEGPDLGDRQGQHIAGFKPLEQVEVKAGTPLAGFLKVHVGELERVLVLPHGLGFELLGGAGERQQGSHLGPDQGAAPDQPVVPQSLGVVAQFHGVDQGACVLHGTQRVFADIQDAAFHGQVPVQVPQPAHAQAFEPSGRVLQA